MRYPARLLAFVFIVVAGLWMAAPPAFGHGLIERSSPAANSALETPPRAVDLWFNEPVDPTFSTATVVDPSGARVSERVTVSPDGRRMTVPLRELSRGFYTVRWRVLSTVDGHTTGGAFAFTVGLGARPPEQFGGTTAPEAGLALVRWIGFSATLLLVGTAWFPTLLGPGLRRVGPLGARHAEERAASALRVLTLAAAVVVIATAAFEIVLRAVSLTEAPLREVVATGQIAHMVWGTKPGWGAVIRSAMAVLLLLPRTPWGRLLRGAGLFWFVLLAIIFALMGGPVALAGSGHLALVVLVGAVYGLVSVMLAMILPQIRDFRIPDLAFVPPLTGAAMLAGLTINSHAWGGGPLAAVVDWMHLLAVSIWIGGLFCLMIVLLAAPADERVALARALVPGFSRVAAVSLGAVVATGVYSTWVHVPSLQAFATTGYGRFLMAKLVLVVPLIAMGALNRFVVRPKLEALPAPMTEATPRRFLGVAGIETALGLAVVLVVAFLTATPPARTTLATSPEASTALRYAGVAGDFGIGLAIDPAKAGPNRFEVAVTSRGGSLPPAESRVLLRLTHLDEDLAPTTQVLTASGADRYSADVTVPAGWYVAEVVLRRRGQEDVAAAFPLRLGDSRTAATEPAARRLLESAAAAMRSLRAWREEEHITDGLGNLVVANVEIVRPDRLRVRTAGGAEAIFVGSTRYVREGPASWKREVLASPFTAEGVVQYLRDAESVVAGRPASCAGEPCRAVMWDAPGRAASFAAMIGEHTQRIYKILMVAPQHYMTGHLGDFNAPIRVEPPR